MIKYLRHTEIDKACWDQCINTAENSMVYALSWYLDITSPEWDALVLGNYEAVMPLTWRKKFGFKYLVQPYLSQQLGVFGRGDAIKEVDRFIKVIPSKFVMAKICLNKWNVISGEQFSVAECTNYELLLHSGYDVLKSQFSMSNKKNIAKSQKNKPLIKGIDQYPDFIKIVKEGLNKKTILPTRFCQVLSQLIRITKSNGTGELKGVYNSQGKLLAAAMFLTYSQRKILLVSASNSEGITSKAMFFLLDNYISFNSNSLLLLDFEGSNIESIAYFFKGFGAKETRYSKLNFSKNPFVQFIIK